MKRFAFSIIMLATALLLSAGPTFKGSINESPRDAIAYADSLLSLKNSTPTQRMCGIMLYSTTTLTIDPDSATSVVRRIENHIAKEDDQTIRGLMQLFSGVVLNDIYSQNRYKYNRVDAPLSPLPDNILEWSGEQFTQQVDSLVNEAVLATSKDGNKPLKDFNEIIECDDNSCQLYPKLRDFVYNTAINLAKDDAKKLHEEIVSLTTPGTLEWAVWIAKGKEDIYKYYQKYPDGDVGNYLLLHYIRQAYYRGDSDEELINLLRNQLAKDKTPSILRNQLEDELGKLTEPYVNVSVKEYCQYGKPISVTFKSGYSKTAGFNIYKVGEKEPLKKIRIEVGENTHAKQDSIIVDIKEAGNYRINAVLNGVEVDNATFAVTPMMPYIIDQCDETIIMMLDYESGKPIKDCSISLDCNKKSELGKTDANGMVKARLAEHINGDNIIAEKGGNKVTFNRILHRYRNDTQNKPFIKSQMLFSRPIYRPGETIEWSYIAAKGDELVCNRGVTMIMYDTNYQSIDTIEQHTDSLGRASGKFVIPTDRLSGMYHISANLDDNIHNFEFLVSEFKTPEFEVIDTEIVILPNKSARISGRATSMAGLPVADADISVRFAEAPKWWLSRSPYSSKYSSYGKTDKDGKFSINCDIKNLPENGYFKAEILVTSATGETASASESFSIGKEFVLYTNNYEPVNIDTDELPIVANTLTGKAAQVEASWVLFTNDSTEVARGICSIDSTSTKINLKNINAGKYKIILTPTDTTRCNIFDTNINLYSINKNQLPVDTELFVPQTNIEASANGKFSYVVGTSYEAYIISVLSEPGKIVDISVKHHKSGFTTFDGVMPENADEIILIVSCLRNGNPHEYILRITREDIKQIEIVAESMRYKLTANELETWNFTLKRRDGTPINGGMIATMYNHSLDLLQAGSLPSFTTLNLMHAKGFTYSNEPRSIHRYNSVAFLSHRINYKNQYNYNYRVPQFTYQPKFSSWSFSPTFVRGASRQQTLSASVLREDADLYEAAEEECVAEAPMMRNSVMNYEASGAMAKESETKSSEPFEYREAEVLQAFFMPDLSFNEDGTATISFTVPNENTTWAFHAWAWSEDLYVANYVKQLMANKPLMVQPNLPRYVREGDSIVVSAAVSRLAPSADTITTTIELFNPADGSIISTSAQTNILSANESATANISISVPTGMSSIGYRIKASDGSFADGEQTLLAILPSSSTVIESETFYLTDQNPSFEATIADSGTTTLQYCQNPVWDVVKALPALYYPENRSVFGTVYSAYGALTAQGLLKRFPEIKQTLDAWSDSTLTSDLYKNEKLKQLMLQQTPWMQAAASETERMQLLRSTFDKKEIEHTLSKAIKHLSKLQLEDGGFAWCEWWQKSSTWTTYKVLLSLGELNSLGFLTDDFDSIIAKALKYIDATVEDVDLNYALIYSYFPKQKPSTLAGQQSIDATIQHILKNRSSMHSYDKAQAALILDAFNHKAVAKEIIKSLRQYEVKSPQAGISFPSITNIDTYAVILQAFAKIDPQQNELDAMRQWLILRSQVSDDLGTWNPTSLISSILLTGSQWLSLNNSPAVTLNGSSLGLGAIELASGSFSQQIASGHLEIIRPADGAVSYGSLTTVMSKQADIIDAHGSDEISITKRVLVNRNGQWEEATSFARGEVVRVQMLVTTSRDLEYITLKDERPATFEPLPSEQTPRFVYSGGCSFYREMNDASTNLFIYYLPKGTYYLNYDATAMFSGNFTSGIATIQSQYAPEISAHSAGGRIDVKQ